MTENEVIQNLAKRAQIKAKILSEGKSLSMWAKNHGFMPRHVYDLLDGRTSGKFGEARRIAVLLGLKEGKLEKSA